MNSHIVLLLLLVFYFCFSCNSNKQNNNSTFNESPAEFDISIVKPENNTDHNTLKIVNSLENGQTKQIDMINVTVISSYYSAAGFMCKTITIARQNNSKKKQYRLACKIENTWRFIPNIQNQTPDNGTI